MKTNSQPADNGKSFSHLAVTYMFRLLGRLTQHSGVAIAMSWNTFIPDCSPSIV